ncbi:MAG TPA: hydantoinase/oxoprolinase family protein, partial [Planctomycetota bacterium]|nr:hydantoinase/oxoprolinase family protein [Planctomycetota bacterium]
KGSEATVSDAHLVLGRLPATGLLGGGFALDAQRARDAVARLGEELGLSIDDCARGILDVADLQMARPLRAFTLGRGIDPKDVALVAFGGAGGLHAVRLARLVGFERVIVPPMQGALSAFGMLLARRVFERERAFVREVDKDGASELARCGRDLLAETKRLAPAKAVEGRCFAMLRYRGNQAEFWVEADAAARERFELEFERRFGFRQDLPVEALRVRARLTLEGSFDEAVANAFAAKGRELGKGRRRRESADQGPLPFVQRSDLDTRRFRAGPFAVLDYSGTTIVEAGSRARLENDCISILCDA